MPFDRPSLTDLIVRTETDLLSRLPAGDSALRVSLERVVARAHAGAVHGLYGDLASLANQLMPDTADGEHLLRWCGVFGISRKEAVAATGLATVTGEDDSVVAAGSRLQRDDGAEYVVTDDVTIAGGTAAAPIEAAVAGLAGVAAAGVALTFVSPIGGVNSGAVVAGGGVAGGADIEALDDLRVRLLARIREQPQGGAARDYKRWALEVPGVTRAWVFPERDGLGTVGVTFVMDGRVDIIPEAGDLTAVDDYIDPLRPVTADVTVFAPTPVAMDPHITLTPNTAEVQAAVIAELQDLLAREAEPGGVILLSHIREAVSVAAGESDNAVTAPVANITPDDEEIVVLGTPVFS